MKLRLQPLNPIPAGVLENQDMRGEGGQIDPPPSVSWFSSTPAGIGLRVYTLHHQVGGKKS